MKNTYSVEYCGNCKRPVDLCECETENEECPFCSLVDEVLEDIIIADSYEERFAILHSVISEARDTGLKEGYKKALSLQAEIIEDILEDIECEEDCDGCCEDCECCKDN